VGSRRIRDRRLRNSEEELAAWRGERGLPGRMRVAVWRGHRLMKTGGVAPVTTHYDRQLILRRGEGESELRDRKGKETLIRRLKH